MNRTSRAGIGLAALGLTLTGCSGADSSTTPSTSTTSSMSTAEARTLTVYAAASLATTFPEIGERFEADNPGVTVEFSFAGSADLVTQITAGAPADVVATADEKNMTKLSGAGLLDGDPVVFATNTLEIVTAPGNPEKITSFADLARKGLDVVVCAPQVPCGAAAEKVEQATGVRLTPVSEENSVTDVLGRVTSGEADAGLVYVTDVQAAGDGVTGVEFPESAAAVNTYPIAALDDAADPSLAASFRDAVAGAPGRDVLGPAGFGAPA